MSSTDMRRAIDLAAEKDFRLGDLSVSPSTARASAGGAETRVEPRVMQVLVVLAKADGRTVTREQLVDACWSGKVVTDDAITRTIAKVRQLAQIGGHTHFTLETVPKLGFRLVSAKSAPPQDEVASPVGESQPEPQPQQPSGQSRTIAAASLALIAAAAVLVAVILWRTNTTQLADTAQIEVSTFRTLGTDPVLAQLSAKSRDAVTRLLTAAGLSAHIADAPSTSGSSAAYEVTGTLSRDRNYYVARASIARKADNAVLWSRSFETPFVDATGLDEEIASAIAAVLKCGLLESGATSALVTKNFADVLNACTATVEVDQPALDATRRLLAATQDDVAALSLRAIALARRTEEMDVFKNDELAMTQEARAAAERALALDPNAYLAQIALGFRLGDAPRFAEREQMLMKAMQLAPSSPLAQKVYIRLLREVGRLSAAVEVAQTLETDADRRLQTAPQIALLYASAGDVPRALRVIDRMGVARPFDAPSASWTIALWWQDPRQLTDDFWQLTRVLVPENQTKCLREYMPRLTQANASARGLPPECASFAADWQVRMLAREGDLDGAYAMMQDDLPNSRRWTMFFFYPEMKAFRQDRRFIALAERLGLIDYWKKTGNWPDFCEVEGCAALRAPDHSQ